MYIKEKKRKYYLTIYNFKFKYVKKKNLHEGDILYLHPPRISKALPFQGNNTL